MPKEIEQKRMKKCRIVNPNWEYGQPDKKYLIVDCPNLEIEQWKSAAYWQRTLKVDYVSAVRIVVEIIAQRKEAQREMVEKIEVKKNDYEKQFRNSTSTEQERYWTGKRQVCQDIIEIIKKQILK